MRTDPTHARPMSVALLLSCDTFEMFFEGVLGLDKDRYLHGYRNDWSWYYAKGLRENGLRPVLYLPSLKYDGLHETDTGVPVRFLKLPGWYQRLAWTRRPARATRWTMYAQERLNAAALLRPLRAGLADDGVQLLYTQEHWTGRFDHLVHRLPVPVSGADHGAQAWEVVKWFKRAAFRRSASCYGQTEDECRQMRAYGADAVFLPNGCDTDFFRPEPAVRKAKTILTIARLTDGQKRTSDLIRALARMGEDWSLDVAGTGPDRGMLEALAAELGVSGRVRFRGFVDRASVRDLLWNCGVYAMPSSNEGMCMAMLEAMATGAAVVASRIRAFTPLIRDRQNGRLVDVGDVAGLASAIGDAWEHRATYGVAAATTVAADYDSRKRLRQLADRIRGTAGSTAPADVEWAGALA